MPQSRAKPGGGSVQSEGSMSNESDTSTSITSPVLSAESQGSQSSFEENEGVGQIEEEVERDVGIVAEIVEARQEMVRNVVFCVF
jgi:hypothetical protein